MAKKLIVINIINEIDEWLTAKRCGDIRKVKVNLFTNKTLADLNIDLTFNRNQYVKADSISTLRNNKTHKLLSNKDLRTLKYCKSHILPCLTFKQCDKNYSIIDGIHNVT